MQCPFDADYFLRGKECGLSNYSNYSWLGEPTIALAKRLIEVMQIGMGETFLDFGCARGYLVKAMRQLEIEAYGYDISEWAVQNCDPDVKDYVRNSLLGNRDHVLIKDVAEHIQPYDLADILSALIGTEPKTILIIVPLTKSKGGKYIRYEDGLDATHVIHWPLQDWMSFVQGCIKKDEFTLAGSWHIPGLKPTSLTHLKSCGFIMLKRHAAP